MRQWFGRGLRLFCGGGLNEENSASTWGKADVWRRRSRSKWVSVCHLGVPTGTGTCMVLPTSTVFRFIGPEYLYDSKQITRAALEDHFCGKLLGLPMGCDICYTNHAEADQDDMDNLLRRAPCPPVRRHRLRRPRLPRQNAWPHGHAATALTASRSLGPRCASTPTPALPWGGWAPVCPRLR